MLNFNYLDFKKTFKEFIVFSIGLAIATIGNRARPSAATLEFIGIISHR